MLIQGGRISSGTSCTVPVVGEYWINSISLLRYTTLPGESARLRPGANAVASTMLSLPSLMSCIKLRVPSAMLAPPVSTARFSAAGLAASCKVGLIASTNWRRWKLRCCRSAALRPSASPACRSSQSDASKYKSFSVR